MSTLKFEPWPKIHRLYRDVIITEKLDGSNSAIVIEPLGADWRKYPVGTEVGGKMDGGPAPGIVVNGHLVYAQSRKRVIAPGKQSDNFGFAGFVRDNAEALVESLGEGRHFGEWFGNGIQRGYGLEQKYFALFNVERWHDQPLPERVTTVPILHEGTFSEEAVQSALNDLRLNGSKIVGAQDFLPAAAEGIVVYHKQGNVAFKVTLDNDGIPKSKVRHAHAQA